MASTSEEKLFVDEMIFWNNVTDFKLNGVGVSILRVKEAKRAELLELEKETTLDVIETTVSETRPFVGVPDNVGAVPDASCGVKSGVFFDQTNAIPTK